MNAKRTPHKKQGMKSFVPVVTSVMLIS